MVSHLSFGKISSIFTNHKCASEFWWERKLHHLSSCTSKRSIQHDVADNSLDEIPLPHLGRGTCRFTYHHSVELHALILWLLKFGLYANGISVSNRYVPILRKYWASHVYLIFKLKWFNWKMHILLHDACFLKYCIFEHIVFFLPIFSEISLSIENRKRELKVILL